MTVSKKHAVVEAEAASRTMRADRRFLWLWLTVATSLSVAGNVGHAVLTVAPGPQRGMAIGWASAPPALLMLAIHGLPTLARMLGRNDRDRLLTVVAWGVTVGAFAWSAYGIFTFTVAMGVPTRIAWVAPVVIDLSVFGATRGLVLTAPLAARMKVGIAPAEPSALASSVHVTRPTTRATDPKMTPSGAVATRAADPKMTPSGAVATRAADHKTTPSGAVATLSGDRVPTPAGAATAPELTTLATRIVNSGAVRQPAGVVAEILSELESGGGLKPTAARLGVTPGVVRNVRDAAAAQVQDRSARQLTAV